MVHNDCLEVFMDMLGDGVICCLNQSWHCEKLGDGVRFRICGFLEVECYIIRRINNKSATMR